MSWAGFLEAVSLSLEVGTGVGSGLGRILPAERIDKQKQVQEVTTLCSA